jgi:outer membrane protein assembly factor BamB
MTRNVTLGGLIAITLVVAARAADGPDELWTAAREGDAAVVKRLLDGGVDANAKTPYGATALSFAAEKGHIEVVRLLIHAGADVNVKDTFYNATPLTWATSKNHAEVIRELLAAGVKGGDALVLAATRGGNVDLLRAVLDKAKPNDELLTAALVLVPVGQPAIKEMLDKAGAKPAPADTADQFQPLIGPYITVPGGGAWEATVVEGQLVLKSGGRVQFILRPTGALTFKVAGETATVTFQKTDDAVSGAEYRDGSTTLVLKRGKADPPPATPTPPAAAAEAPVKPVEEPTGVVLKPLDWPQFRGVGATGVADGQFPPTGWDIKTGHNVRWKTPIPGLGHSCPVIVGDRVYVTTAVSGDAKATLRPGQYGDVDSVIDPTEHNWMVFCLDKFSGKVLWEHTAATGVPKVKRHLKGTHANPTPASDGDRIVVSFGSEGLFCYSRDGVLLWKRDLGALDSGWFYDADYQWGFGSSPIVYRGTIFVQCDVGKGSYLGAFSLSDGRELWTTPREEIPSWGTPTVVEGPAGPELVTNATKFARGYDPAIGKELWRLGRHSEITVPTPFAAGGLVFVTDGYRPVQPIYAVRPGARGDITLQESETRSEHIAWSKTRGGPYLPTPIAYGEYLYMCPNSGIIGCYELATGKQVYTQRLGGGYTASPVAADGRLYFTSEEGHVRVVKAGPKFELLATNAMGETCMSTPAISDGQLFVRTERHLVALARDIAPHGEKQP